MLRLEVHGPFLKLLVSCEIHTLVCRLSEGGERDTPIEGSDSFLADNGKGSMGGVAVSRDVEGISQ